VYYFLSLFFQRWFFFRSFFFFSSLVSFFSYQRYHDFFSRLFFELQRQPYMDNLADFQIRLLNAYDVQCIVVIDGVT
jgi:hypothetical protein